VTAPAVIVAGTFRLPPENLDAARQHIKAVIDATRQEPACIDYSYAEDLADPGLIRVFEVWRDAAGLEAHFQAPHMISWVEIRKAFGLFDRRIFAYEGATARQL
jgi:quinol monooxygenase YgiN